jgi:hypothetical protein
MDQHILLRRARRNRLAALSARNKPAARSDGVINLFSDMDWAGLR